MDVVKHIRLVAHYNQSINAKLYETGANLPLEESGKDRSAFFHQTHHRGQTTTLLPQAGLAVGVTDLLALIPEEPAA